MDGPSAAGLTPQTDWRLDAIAWLGRKVRIIDGPSTETGRHETGTIICVDATDYRPSAWVKLEEVGNHPHYRSCDLCWLEDAATQEEGPVWGYCPTTEDHGKLDASVVADRISSRITQQAEEVARADHSRTVYARALEKMRIALVNVHDNIEDEGDRVYFGSTNHVDDLKAAWQLADALQWDQVMEDTQPKTELAAVNLRLQDERKALAEEVARLREALRPFVDLRAQNGAWGVISKKLDGMSPLTVTVTKSQMLEAFSALNEQTGGEGV